MDQFFETESRAETDGLRSGALALRLVLNGCIDEPKDTALRIESFFFPYKDKLLQDADGMMSRWYFSERLRTFAVPTTSYEVVAELRSLEWDKLNKSRNCRIVRVSGGGEFPQVISGRLDRTGEQTIKCMEAGIPVIYVVNAVEGQQNVIDSVEKFQNFL